MSSHNVIVADGQSGTESIVRLFTILCKLKYRKGKERERPHLFPSSLVTSPLYPSLNSLCIVHIGTVL